MIMFKHFFSILFFVSCFYFSDYTRDPDKRAILHMRQELVRDMDVMAIVRDMRAQGTLSASDEERVMVGRSREEQSSRMVTVLLGRGSGVLDDFVVSLKEMNIRLAEALQNERQQQQQRAGNQLSQRGDRL